MKMSKVSALPQSVQHGRTVLYISYDGLTDPLGRSQVLPYLLGLAARGHRITVLSCEKPDRLVRDQAEIVRLCEQGGLVWVPLAYHKRPPVLSSVYDAAMLQHTASRLHRNAEFEVVHCRSYIPAIAGSHLQRRHGVRLLFDIRGFWPDEKVEGNSWNLSNPVFRATYAYFKRLEKKLLASADHVVSLTHEGKRELLTRPNLGLAETDITVIPCCVDFDHFTLIEPSDNLVARRTLGIGPERKVVGYLGSLGAWYMLDEMFDFFLAYRSREPDALFLFITHNDPAPILAAAARKGLETHELLIRAAARQEVPLFMSAADFGIFFIKPVFSKKASSPTKMGEMLALGRPIVTNAGVGDVADIVADTGCGVAIDRFDADAYDRAIECIRALEAKPAEIRCKALPWFDVALGIERYDRLYRLLGQSPVKARQSQAA